MSWPLALLVALLTAAAGLCVGGYVGMLAIGWYRISGFEGGAGYFMVSIALVGAVVGAVVGGVVARLVPAFLPALGVGLVSVVALGALGGGVARLRADVAPVVDGARQLLAVEVRWPASQTERPAAQGPNEPTVVLLSLASGGPRDAGPLWLDDARRDDGRWVAPGVVDITTNRGTRALGVSLGGPAGQAAQIPLGAPGAADSAWGAWLPVGDVEARYRVVPAGSAVRADSLGAFEIATRASGFVEEARDGANVIAASARFDVRHRGRPVAIATEPGAAVTALAALAAAPRAALLAHVSGGADDAHACRLVIDDGDSARVETLGECYGLDPVPLVPDPARLRALNLVRGRFHRAALGGAHYLVSNAVIDVAALTVRHLTAPDADPIDTPLAVSPGVRSLAYAGGSDEAPVLVVRDVARDAVHRVPIDVARTHFPGPAEVDAAWVARFFAWRDEGGAERLVPRADAVADAYRGTLSLTGMPMYTLRPAGPALRDTVVELLVRALGGEALPSTSPPDYEQRTIPVRVSGRVLDVSYTSATRGVTVTLADDPPDVALMRRVAAAVDAALATGRHDALFAP